MRKLFRFIAKIPPRTVIGFSTLWIDIYAYIIIGFNSIFNKKNSETIWICIGNYNRTKSLIQYPLQSILQNCKNEKIALSIFDCGSDDYIELKNFIEKNCNIPYVIQSEKIEFSRARAFNKAINQCTGNMFFILDADISFDKRTIKTIRKILNKKAAWFPICQWQKNADSDDWRWFSEGTGIFAATKEQLKIVGLYNEEFTTWGKEDWELYFRFYKYKIAGIRTKQKGLYHHWHESNKPGDFENYF